MIGGGLALLMLLAARGLPGSDEERAMIGGCTDVAVLNQWIVRAATASSVAEVLTPSAPKPGFTRRYE